MLSLLVERGGVMVKGDIRKILEDNAVAEMRAVEDARFIAAVDAAFKLCPPFRTWYEGDSVVHMSGLRLSQQERWTRCGIFLHPDLTGTFTQEEVLVTCLACLAE
jgi:hypothetical protein